MLESSGHVDTNNIMALPHDPKLYFTCTSAQEHTPQLTMMHAHKHEFAYTERKLKAFVKLGFRPDNDRHAAFDALAKKWLLRYARDGLPLPIVDKIGQRLLNDHVCSFLTSYGCILWPDDFRACGHLSSMDGSRTFVWSRDNPGGPNAAVEEVPPSAVALNEAERTSRVLSASLFLRVKEYFTIINSRNSTPEDLHGDEIDKLVLRVVQVDGAYQEGHANTPVPAG